MSRIPRVRTWTVNVRDNRNRIIETFHVPTINRSMARIIIKMDYPRTWGHKLTISLAR